LQVIGVPNAYCALLARQAGFTAMYLSGTGVANMAYGRPDLGLISRTEVVEEARRITATTSLPPSLALRGEMGYPHALSTPTWRFQDSLFHGRAFL